ncbi:putative exported domain protein [Haemophilus influenzae]|nr:hypothetical protein [Haemophilus influenzae]AVI95220.1 putative exported domain protein [Haemophilus influenzae]AVI96993.1 putative exported domain protein [Haemophilus influenzae]
MQMKANKAFYVIGGITALVVTLMAGFLFSGSSSTTTAETKKEDALDLSQRFITGRATLNGA